MVGTWYVRTMARKPSRKFPPRWTRRDARDKRLIADHIDRSVARSSPPPRVKKEISPTEFEATLSLDEEIAFCPRCEAVMMVRERAVTHTMNNEDGSATIGTQVSFYYKCSCQARAYVRNKGFIPDMTFQYVDGGYVGELTDSEIIPKLVDLMRQREKRYTLHFSRADIPYINVIYNKRTGSYTTELSACENAPLPYNLPGDMLVNTLKHVVLGVAASSVLTKLKDFKDPFPYAYAVIHRSVLGDRVSRDEKNWGAVIVEGGIHTYIVTNTREVFITMDGKQRRKLALESCAMPSDADVEYLVGTDLIETPFTGECNDILKIFYLLIHDRESARNDFVFGRRIE